MTIPSLMTILSAPGSPATTTSAVAGAELPGSGQVGFASLVQMLLGQQQAPASEVPGAGADGGATQPGASTGTGAESAAAGSEAVDPASGPAGDPAGSNPGAVAGSGLGAGTAWGAPADAANPPASPAPGAHRRGTADIAGSPAEDTGDTEGEASEVAGILGVAPQVSPPVAGRDGAGAAPAGQVAAVADAPPAGGARTPRADPAAQAPADAGFPTAPGMDGTAAAGVSRDADATAGSTAPAPATPQHAADLGQTQPAGAVGGVAVAAPSAGAAHAPTGSAPTAAPVAGQVFPEVVRLVTRGDGTQRLTLRLSPENLGEVRIVVTVRDGGVDVRLAAGADAQEALRHGSADLRRLLEGVGATSTQIVVRDLPGAATSPGQTPGTGAAATYADTGGGHGRDHQRGGDASDHQPGQHQTSGPAHTGVRPQPATSTASAAAAGVDLRL